MIYVCNKIAKNKNSFSVGFYIFTLITFSIFISSIIEYYTNSKIHIQNNHFNTISPTFKPFYVGLSSTIYCYPLLILAIIYAIVKKNKTVEVYRTDIINKTYSICLINIITPLIYLVFTDLNSYIVHIIMHVNILLYSIILLWY